MKFVTLLYLFVLLFTIHAPSPAAGGWSSSPDTTLPVVTEAGNQWNARVTTDGHHGAIIVWQDRRDGITDKLFIQRVAANGTLLWSEGGIPLALTPGYQYYPSIVEDGNGGAFIAWQDNRSGVGYDIYMQHVDGDGEMLLPDDGLAVCTAAGHQYYPTLVRGPGEEVIVAWQDKRAGNFDIYAQRVNTTGKALWGKNGALVCGSKADQVDPVMTTDGSGGAIIAWTDYRHNSGFADIYTQKVNWNGGTAWELNGIAVSQASNNQWNPQVVSDGGGGVYVVWQDRRNSFYDIVYAQKFDSLGTAAWLVNGLPMTDVEGNQYYPRAADDGLGGVVIVWQDNRSGTDYDIYAQRVNSGGQLLWSGSGREVSSAPAHQYYPRIVHQGNSFVIVWQDRRDGSFDIYAQRLNISGENQWTSDGVAVTMSQFDQYIPDLASDGLEGAVICWADFKMGKGATDIFANRIGANGLLAGGTFRTMSQDSLNKRGVRIRKKKVAMPNEGNVRDSVFGRGVFSQGMIIGVERPDSAKRYGWIYYRRSYYIRRTLPQIGEVRGFDRRFDKPFLGKLRNPTRYRYNNAMVGEQIALKMNIAASDVGITPGSFGDLIYRDENNPGDPLNGISLRAVSRRVDSMLTYWKAFPGLNYNTLYGTMRRINRAFTAQIDTISLRPLVLTPVNTLFSLDFLVPNTNPPEEIPQYVALANIPEEEIGYKLSQNYPNPFNPMTTIEFSLPEPSVVSLKVYDLTGREVAALIDREETPEGFQAVDFEAGSLSSGIYFYRIIANPITGSAKGFNVVGKMILMK